MKNEVPKPDRHSFTKSMKEIPNETDKVGILSFLKEEGWWGVEDC